MGKRRQDDFLGSSSTSRAGVPARPACTRCPGLAQLYDPGYWFISRAAFRLPGLGGGTCSKSAQAVTDRTALAVCSLDRWAGPVQTIQPALSSPRRSRRSAATGLLG